MAVILAVVTGSDADTTLLDHAAAAFDGGHVEVLHVRRDPREAIPLVGEGLSPDLVQRMLDEAAQDTDRRAQHARATFDAWRVRSGADISAEPCASETLTTRWTETVGRLETIVPTTGRLADLIVLGRPGTSGVDGQAAVEAALFGSGRPVLLIPHGAPVGRDAAAIFWNGSAEASRAVGAALPTLRRCAKVHVIQLHEHPDTPPAKSELADYLAWHGISASIATPAADYRDPGEALLQEAARLGANLIVMGAYTHSRMRQMILGGVTSHVMTAADVPILLSH